MIRMLGAVCLAAGPVWLGMSAAAELAHRERALGALCAGLELMERELALRLPAKTAIPMPSWKNSLPVSSKPESIRSRQWMSPA